MKKIFLAIILVFLFASTVRAQTRNEFDELRANRGDFKAYIQEVIRRRLAVDVAQAMTLNGFKKDDIQKVLKGDGFDTYAKRVIRSKDVEQALTFFLDRILAPGAIEEALAKQRQESEIQKRNQLLMAVEEILRNQKKLADAETPKKELSLWERIWERLRKDLMDG